MEITIIIDDLRIEKEISQEMRNNLIRLALDIPAQRPSKPSPTEIIKRKKPIPSPAPIIKRKIPIEQLPVKVTKYLTNNPEIPIIKVSKMFGIPYNRLHYWAYKTDQKRKFQNLTRKKKQEIRKYILENPTVHLHKIAKMFLTCPSSLGRHFSKEIKKTSKLRRKGISAVPKPSVKTRPTSYQKRKPLKFYAKTKAKLLEIVLSDKIPDEFTSNDVYESTFGTQPRDDYKNINKEYFRRTHMIKKYSTSLREKRKSR